MPQISIIVPVYNVELYLEKCIDSILNQIFKDFELILVDDGSTDSSGKICDEYALKDRRVKVIHKKNGGQSSARNTGIDIAQGNYIGFVDSDDWIEPDMYEVLYKNCKNNNCDIGVIGINFVYKDKRRQSLQYPLQKWNKKEAMLKLIEHKYFGNYFCSKLFSKKLFKEIKFKEEIIYEDIDLMYKIINKAEYVIAEGVFKYNYLQREGSTVRNKDINYDEFYVKKERIEFLKKYYPNTLNYAEKDLFFTALKSLENSRNTEKSFEDVIKVLKKYYKYMFSMDLNYKTKILLTLLKINKNLYIFCSYLINKRRKYKC